MERSADFPSSRDYETWPLPRWRRAGIFIAESLHSRIEPLAMAIREVQSSKTARPPIKLIFSNTNPEDPWPTKRPQLRLIKNEQILL